MPRFKFRDAANKATKPNRSQSLGESNPLISSDQSLNNAMYTQGSNRRSANEGLNRQTSNGARKVSNPAQFTSSSRSPTNSISETPMVKIRAGTMPAPSSPPPSPSVDVDIDFNLVPFKFYTRIGDHWKSGFCQSLAIVLVCLFCPSVLILLFAICSTSYSKFEQKKILSKEIKKIYTFYVLIGILTLAKDLIVVAIVLQLYFKTDASNYIVAYSPMGYCWFLILFIFPIALFYLSEVKYELSSDKKKKKLLQEFSKFFPSPKRQQNQKLSEQDKFFEEKYSFLSTLESIENEFIFVWKATSRHLIYAATGLAFVVCLIHTLVPLFIQLTDLNVKNATSKTLNHTAINHTSKNFTLHTNATESNLNTDAVIGLSTVNSFIVSLLASPYFFYVVLWNFRMLNQWKSFNTNENDPTATLVNGGPQGIAMWWKIRQTLRFFSSSWNCLSVLICKMLCVVCMVFLAVLSITIILKTYSLDFDCEISDLVPILVDNILLYMVLLTLGIFALLINKEMKLSSSMILSKQLNVSYELSRLMNLEQGSIEQEPGVKIKVRVMRGCLMLLQEMTSSMAHLENNTSSGVTLLCIVISTIMVIASTVVGSRYLHHY